MIDRNDQLATANGVAGGKTDRPHGGSELVRQPNVRFMFNYLHGDIAKQVCNQCRRCRREVRRVRSAHTHRILGKIKTGMFARPCNTSWWSIVHILPEWCSEPAPVGL